MSTIDQELFTKCLTQGVPVYGAHSGKENDFVLLMQNYIQESTSDYICYIDQYSQENIMFFEVTMNKPILGIKVENEYLIFFQLSEEAGLMNGLTKDEAHLMGDFTMRVISFVSAWNKKVLGKSDKDEYNKLTRVDKNFNSKDLYSKYLKNLNGKNIKHKTKT